METVSTLLAICGWNPPFTGEFPSQMASNTGFDVFVDVCLNRRFQTPECDVIVMTFAAHWTGIILW